MSDMEKQWKKVTTVIKPFKADNVRDALQKKGYEQLTMLDRVTGGYPQSSKGEHYVTDFLPKVQIEIVVPGQAVDQVTKTIQDVAKTGRPGDGIIWVEDIEQVIDIGHSDRSP